MSVRGLFSPSPEEIALFEALRSELSFLDDQELMRLIIVKKTKENIVRDAGKVRDTIMKYTPSTIRLDDVEDVLMTQFIWPWFGAKAKDGSSVVLCNAQALLPSQFPEIKIIKTLFFVVEYLFRIDVEGMTRQGITVLVDLTNLGMKNCDKVLFQKVTDIFEHGWPVKLKHVYLFHCATFVKGIIKLFQPLIKSDKIKARVEIIKYKNLVSVVDSHSLPLEYGGKLSDCSFKSWMETLTYVPSTKPIKVDLDDEEKQIVQALRAQKLHLSGLKPGDDVTPEQVRGTQDGNRKWSFSEKHDEARAMWNDWSPDTPLPNIAFPNTASMTPSDINSSIAMDLPQLTAANDSMTHGELAFQNQTVQKSQHPHHDDKPDSAVGTTEPVPEPPKATPFDDETAKPAS
eukprot:PhF_6_TR1537/c0_g1_i1/m.2808